MKDKRNNTNRENWVITWCILLCACLNLISNHVIIESPLTEYNSYVHKMEMVILCSVLVN